MGFKALKWPQGYKKGDFHEPKCVNVPHGLLQQGGHVGAERVAAGEGAKVQPALAKAEDGRVRDFVRALLG